MKIDEYNSLLLRFKVNKHLTTWKEFGFVLQHSRTTVRVCDLCPIALVKPL